jgi:uncharacterized protein
MSKPDSAGESLESILASIRKSLAEQSTDALSEKAPAAAEAEARPRRPGLTQRLAGTPPDPRSAAAGAVSDDLSDLLEGPPAPARRQTDAPGPGAAGPGRAPAAEPTEPTAADAGGEKDPLWFLTRREEPDPPPPAASEKTAETVEPALTRPEVFRASLPPFFGSSAPAATPPAPTPDPPARNAPAAMPQPSPVTASAVKAADPALAHEVTLVAAAAEQAAARLPAAAPSPVPNGKAAPADEALQLPSALLDTAHNRALEAMVLDLLKPMLRQWLDENMPRLVAEALDDEVKRVRKRGVDAGKT